MSEDNKEEDAKKEAIQKERDSIKVTTIEPPDEDKDEQDKKDSEEEKEKEGEEDEEKDDSNVGGGGEDDKAGDDEDKDIEDKEELKARKKEERIERKFQREVAKRKELEKKYAALEAKLAADPEKKLTEEDVETLAERKAQEKQLLKEFNAAVDRLADGAQKHLKLKTKVFDSLVAEVTDELGPIPSMLIGALDDMDNGPVVLAYLFKNVDEAEDIYKLKDRPAKLGMELEKLSMKLAEKPKKKISQVPDPIEPLGGKSTVADRLTQLANKKTLTSEEMSEYVQARNADVAAKRKNGRHGLR